MLKKCLLAFAIALMMAPALLQKADARVYAHGGAYHGGSAVVHGGAYRGPGGGVVVHGGAYRGPSGGAVVHGGAYRVGGRYYGGTWYGPHRRFYGGRWWPYGVGSCWVQSPIGFVWICG
jgi:hypothetical protein